MTILLGEVTIGEAEEMNHEGTGKCARSSYWLHCHFALDGEIGVDPDPETANVLKLCSDKKTLNSLPDDQSIRMAPLFCCVDCGGTKAAAVIADADANILGRGIGGPANFKDVERSAFLSSVKTAVEDALNTIDYGTLPADVKQTLELAAAGSRSPSPVNRGQRVTLPTSTGFYSGRRSFLGATLPRWLRRSSASPPQGKLSPSRLQVSASDNFQISARITLPTRKPLFAAIWAGCAGVDRPQDIADLTPLLSELFSIPSSSSPPGCPGHSSFIPRLIIDNDTALLASPLHHHASLVGSAVVAIAGTGCIVVSFKPRPDGGLECLGRAGGWGWLLGDEGSGFYIGREALRRILDGADYETGTATNVSSHSGIRSASPSSAPFDDGSPGPTLVVSPTFDIETVAGDENLSPSSTISLPSPISSTRTVPPTISSTTSTSSFPHPQIPTKLPVTSASPPSARPPSLQERIFAYYGITQPADILTVVYAPDPPSPASAGSAPKLMGSTPPTSSTVVAAPLGPLVANTALPQSGSSSRLSLKTRTFEIMPSCTPRPSHKNQPTTVSNEASSLSAPSTSPAGAGYANIERKARMAALTPIVFHSAFVDGDELALDILESASEAVARLIARNLAPLTSSPTQSQLRWRPGSGLAKDGGEAFTAKRFGAPIASSSVLCLGGSLVGVPAYRALVLKHLQRMGHVFPYVEHVPDAAQAGVLRLVAMGADGTAAS